MKVLISDHKASMMPDHTLEIKTLREGLGENVDIDIYEYNENDRAAFYEHLKDADALLTAFIPMDEEAFKHAPKLKVIALNATGWDSVDINAATKYGVGVCPIGEYCTWDVAESAIAYIFALNKHFKFYTHQIDVQHVWDFAAAPQYPRIEDQTLGIVGFGKIGKCTARKAKNLVHDIIVYDPFVQKSIADQIGVVCVNDVYELYSKADIIVNHMNLTAENHQFFDESAFLAMKKRPIFINLGRGLSVDETALIKALDKGLVRAFGADVLYDETPDLKHNKLVGRDNVIITPHSAFYSTSSMRDIQIYSCNNIINLLHGRKEKLYKLINDVKIKSYIH